MTTDNKFPYKAGDIVRFPDTESEYVDVGVGTDVKVAETECYTIMRVAKRGRGYQLVFMYKSDYSETFHKKAVDYKGRIKTVSLHEYIEYFGNYSTLEKIGNIKTWEEDSE